MGQFRDYPDKEMFENFPQPGRWELVRLEQEDFPKIYCIDYSYWNELSSYMRKPSAAAVNIRNGVEIYGVSNQPFWEGADYLKKGSFSSIILLSCKNEKYLIVEGHSRMTVYGLVPQKFAGSCGYIGYVTVEQMRKYDEWMSR
ncbi:MAG: hypothetical protein HFG27_04685 [Provencibacterium sp.]|jgi:hypothetical protein|nr:hypothetical protein [Provencibacterium sp.]